MTQVVIENPILNSPFGEPTRHFKFTDEGISNDVAEGRRTSSYFVPIAKPKKKGAKQLDFGTEWTQDRIEENKLVNKIRRRISLWREGGYVGVTPPTARLLAYWTDPAREKKLFFCQIEALETAIYIAEVAKKYGDAWIENEIREANDTSNPGLPRTAFKMATGSGKTVVMAMLIAWHTLNNRANPQDARFSDTFLIVTPGITIRDRLRVLLPNDPENYYHQRDIVPAQLQDQLGQAKILITNFHAFQLREKFAAGKLGEQVRCVVSVSMLTEGWDANTVTHVLGVRAFGTQLLCEQVVGRALRRMSYAANEHGHFDPEYAEVYGVPFSFIPCSGATPDPKPGPLPTRVRALESRVSCEITFPRLLGYRYDVGDELLSANFTPDSKLTLSTADLPTRVENAPIVGESSIHTLDDLKRRRPNEVAFLLAKLTLEKYFRDDEGNDKPWLFPQLLDIAKRWLAECVTLKDNTFRQLLLLIEFAHDAADRIYKAIVASTDGNAALKPILRPYDAIGSTRYVDFDTTRPVYATKSDKCHIGYVVADTDSWEQKMAQSLEDMPEVIRYVKNQNLGFAIPYTLNGEEHQYIPDFIVCIDDGHGPDDLLNLIIEVTGEKKKEKAAKVATARTLWVPAINNHGGLGRWAFVEVDDPWDGQNAIRKGIAAC